MDGLAELRRGALVPARRPRPRHAHLADRATPRGRAPDRGRASLAGRRWASRPRSCRWPTSRSARRSGPTRAGSSSRSTSSTATRPPTSARSASAAIESARPTPEVVAALAAADIIVIAPSNPIVSIGPILALPGLGDALGRGRARAASRSSPSAGSSAASALKGPADRMLASLGHESSALGVAALYADVATAFVARRRGRRARPGDRRHSASGHGVIDTVMSDDPRPAPGSRATCCGGSG